MRTIDEIKADMQKPCDYTDKCELEFELRCALIYDLPTDRLEEICQAERDGRCVVLPCKVGDTVYELSYDCAMGIRYDPFNENGNSTAGLCLKCETYPCDLHNAVREETIKSMHWILGNKELFGKTVFLTREEAEEALKEVNHEHDT